MAASRRVDPRQMSARQMARAVEREDDLVLALMEVFALLEDKSKRFNPPAVVRHLGWRKARLVWTVLFPKTPLRAPGSLYAEPISCGKPNCRCASGEREDQHTIVHHVWWDGERQRREYVRSRDREALTQAIDRWREWRQGDGRRSAAEKARKRVYVTIYGGFSWRREPFTRKAPAGVQGG